MDFKSQEASHIRFPESRVGAEAPSMPCSCYFFSVSTAVLQRELHVPECSGDEGGALFGTWGLAA